MLNQRIGTSLIEALITVLIISIILIGAIDMNTKMFSQQVVYNKNVQERQTKNISVDRITSKISEAAGVYNSNINISISAGDTIVTVKTGENALAVLIPKFDSTGDISRPSAGETNFTGIVFSIIPESNWNGNTSDNYVLVETDYDITLDTTASDPLKITETYPTDWSSGESYFIAGKFKPATLNFIGQKAFDVENDLVTFAFVPSPQGIYFGSPDGTKTVNDKPFLVSTKFRNYRVK